MNCAQVEELILSAEENADTALHIRDCSHCAAFARRQRELDVRLRRALPPPVVRPGFEKRLRRRTRAARLRTLVEAYPELVPLASGVAATALCIALRPEWSSVLMLFGGAATLCGALCPALADWLAGELDG